MPGDAVAEWQFRVDCRHRADSQIQKKTLSLCVLYRRGTNRYYGRARGIWVDHVDMRCSVSDVMMKMFKQPCVCVTP